MQKEKAIIGLIIILAIAIIPLILAENFSSFNQMEKSTTFDTGISSGVASDNGAPYATCWTQGIASANISQVVKGTELYLWRVNGTQQQGFGTVYIVNATINGTLCAPLNSVALLAFNNTVNFTQITSNGADGSSTNVTFSSSFVANPGNSYAVIVNISKTVAQGYVRWSKDNSPLAGGGYRGGNSSSCNSLKAGKCSWGSPAGPFRFTLFGSNVSTNTCTSPASGNWAITCSDNCSFVTNQNVPGNISTSGTGILQVKANLTFTSIGQYIYQNSGCQINIDRSGKIGA